MTLAHRFRPGGTGNAAADTVRTGSVPLGLGLHTATAVQTGNGEPRLCPLAVVQDGVFETGEQHGALG